MDKHEAQHERDRGRHERDLEKALLAVESTAALHAVAHKEQHQAHERIHAVEKVQVDKALTDEARANSTHATAHKQEHDAHERVHVVEKAAVDKAEEQMNVRLKSMNEFRDALRDQNASFVNRESYEERHEALKVRVNVVERRIAYYSGAAAAAGFLLALLVRLLGIGG